MFKVTLSDNLPYFHVWGSGHTLETDPTQKGWRCRPAWKGGPLLIGRKGVKGCATLMPFLPVNKEWDVAVYDDSTPEEVIAARCNIALVASFHAVKDIPGFGLEVIRLIHSA